MNTIELKKQVNWRNIFFFGGTALLALVGTPIYLYFNGFSLLEWLLFSFFVTATGLSITVGYHRLYAHATFKAHPFIDFFVLFFGAAAFEQSALKWSAQHRLHHQYVDTDKDPYNIKKGFFYAHMGWFLFWHYDTPYNNVKDLKKKKLLMYQHKYYKYWALGAGVAFPLLIGALTGHLLGALLITVCCRLTLVHHSTFSINSICHMFGKATYDIYASARDHWLVAFLTNGEGYHNFHHRFPTDYRNGVRWYHWDPSKWVISGLARVGLADRLRQVSRFNILAAKLAADNQRLNDRLIAAEQDSNLHKAMEGLKLHYLKLKQKLSSWDQAVKDYQLILSEQRSGKIELRQAALKRIHSARSQFKKSYSQWKELVSLPPLELQQCPLLAI